MPLTRCWHTREQDRRSCLLGGLSKDCSSRCCCRGPEGPRHCSLGSTIHRWLHAVSPLPGVRTQAAPLVEGLCTPSCDGAVHTTSLDAPQSATAGTPAGGASTDCWAGAGVGMKHLTGDIKKSMGKVLAVDQNHYPEMLGRTCIINAPGFFKMIFGIVKPMLDARTQGKIEVRLLK